MDNQEAWVPQDQQDSRVLVEPLVLRVVQDLPGALAHQDLRVQQDLWETLVLRERQDSLVLLGAQDHSVALDLQGNQVHLVTQELRVLSVYRG